MLSPENIPDSEVAWLAGLLEGEGSFFLAKSSVKNGKVYLYPRIVVGMTDRDVIERVGDLLGSSVYLTPVVEGKLRVYRVQADGKYAVAWMQRLLPWMGQRRTSKIREVMGEYAVIDLQNPQNRRNMNTNAEVKDLERRLAVAARKGREWKIRRDDLIRELVMVRGRSQVHVAKLAGISQPGVHDIINRKT